MLFYPYYFLFFWLAPLAILQIHVREIIITSKFEGYRTVIPSLCSYMLCIFPFSESTQKFNFPSLAFIWDEHTVCSSQLSWKGKGIFMFILVRIWRNPIPLPYYQHIFFNFKLPRQTCLRRERLGVVLFCFCLVDPPPPGLDENSWIRACWEPEKLIIQSYLQLSFMWWHFSSGNFFLLVTCGVRGKTPKITVLLHLTSFTTIFSSPNEMHRACS